MRIKYFIITIIFISNIQAQNFYDKVQSILPCSYQLENLKPLVNGTAKYRKAILSPNAKMVLLLGKDKTQILDVNSKEIIRNTNYYYDGQWISDSLIMFQIKNDYRLYQVYPKLNRIAIPIPKLEFINNNTLVAIKDGKQWIVAKIEGNENLYCFGYLFSNDFNKVVIYTNSGKEYIYYLNGNGLINIKDIGISCDWSDDNTNIISFQGLDFGEHYIVESDLYISNIEDGVVCKLTDTKNVLEKYPSWSGDKVTFIDDKTGIVYIADLKKKE